MLEKLASFFKKKDPPFNRILRKKAYALNNGDFISIETYSNRGRSVADHLAPEYVLPPDATDEALGAALLQALSLSRLLEFKDPAFSNEAIEERYQAWIQKMMQLYGYKTKKALFKNMNRCGAVIEDNVLIIDPYYHYCIDGWSGDFIDKEDYVRLPADSPPAEVGAALRLAFSRCKTKGFDSVRLKPEKKKP